MQIEKCKLQIDHWNRCKAVVLGLNLQFALFNSQFAICLSSSVADSRSNLNNPNMSSGLIPINRLSIGLIAASCFLLALAMDYFVGGSGAELWAGSLSRVGVVMCAVWIALPTLMRDTSRMRVSWQTGLGVLLAILMVVRSRAPLKVLIPGAIFAVGTYLILRPRPKKRPPQ